MSDGSYFPILCLGVLLAGLACTPGCEEADRQAPGSARQIPPQLHAERSRRETAELIAAGREAFREQRCTDCHAVGGAASTGPALDQIFGENVQLNDGRVVERDKVYLYRAISDPQAQTVAGYHPQLMPPYAHLEPETRIALVEYIKSLSAAEPSDARVR